MATITVRMEEPVKTKLYDIADELGISVSSMINAFAEDVIRKKRVSFSLDNDYIEDQEMYANADKLKVKGRRSIASGRSSLVV